MELYMVTNGNYVDGYYRERENAVRRVLLLNHKIKELVESGNSSVDRKECYIVLIETDD